MKAKRCTLGVLLFLILLAGGVFALLMLRNAREEQAASAAADGAIPLAAVSGNDLTQIVLHYQGETNTLLYTADGWTLAEDPAYHLDTSACNTMLTALSSLNAKRELSPQAGEVYGFAEPVLTIEVTAAGETDTYTFGASNTMTGDLYVRKNNSNTIYTVSGTKAACFELTRAELFGAFNPAGLTASEIEAVSYTLADGETVTLKANSEPAAESGRLSGGWQGTPPQTSTRQRWMPSSRLSAPMSRHRQQMPTRRRMVLRPRWSQQRSPQPMAQ